MSSHKKVKKIQVRISEAELEILKSESNRKGMSASRILRNYISSLQQVG